MSIRKRPSGNGADYRKLGTVNHIHVFTSSEYLTSNLSPIRLLWPFVIVHWQQSFQIISVVWGKLLPSLKDPHCSDVCIWRPYNLRGGASCHSSVSYGTGGVTPGHLQTHWSIRSTKNNIFSIYVLIIMGHMCVNNLLSQFNKCPKTAARAFLVYYRRIIALTDWLITLGLTALKQ